MMMMQTTYDVVNTTDVLVTLNARKRAACWSKRISGCWLSSFDSS